MKASLPRLNDRGETLAKNLSSIEVASSKVACAPFKEILGSVLKSYSAQKSSKQISVVPCNGESGAQFVSHTKGANKPLSLRSKGLKSEFSHRKTLLNEEKLASGETDGKIIEASLSGLVEKSDKSIGIYEREFVGKSLVNSKDRRQPVPSEVLVHVQGRDLLVRVEDLRSRDFLGKLDGFSSQNKKLNFFARDLKSQAGCLKVASPTSLDSSVYPIWGSEKTSLGFSGLMNDLKKQELVNDTRFWEEWETKVETRLIDKARIILRENERGEIHLRLHPDKLGNVRVALELEGGRAFVRVIVDNAQIKQIFELSQFSIQRSLEDMGLQVSLGFSTSQEQNREREAYASPSFQTTVVENNEGLSGETIEVVLSKVAESLVDLII